MLFACLTMGLTFCAATFANYFGEEFKLDNLQLNLLPLSMFVWYLFAALPTSQLMHRYSIKKIILIGLTIMFGGIISLIFSHNFTQALLTFALLGLGNVILQVIYNPLLSFLAPKNDAASFMILRQIIEALTAITLPFLLIWSQQRFGTWHTVIWAAAFLALIALIWLARTPIPQLPTEKKITWTVIRQLLRQPAIILLLIGIVTIGGFNNSLMTIVPRLLVERTHISFSAANLSNTVFFGLRLIGEIGGAFILLHVKPWRFFRFMSILGVIIMAILLFARPAWLIFTLVGATGFVYSSLTSLIFAQVLIRAPTHQSAASGLVITSWVGASLFSLITGFLTKATNSQTSGLIFFLCCSLFVLYLSHRYSHFSTK